jgi:hypothetical protein
VFTFVVYSQRHAFYKDTENLLPCVILGHLGLEDETRYVVPKRRKGTAILRYINPKRAQISFTPRLKPGITLNFLLL